MEKKGILTREEIMLGRGCIGTALSNGASKVRVTLNKSLMDLVATLDGDELTASLGMDDPGSSISFSHDGTTVNLPNVSPAGAQPITSADALVGSWKLTAAFSDTVNMYGPDGALAKRLGVSDTMVVPLGPAALVFTLLTALHAE